MIRDPQEPGPEGPPPFPPESIAPPAAETGPQLRHAGLGRRLLAGVIDLGLGWAGLGLAVYAAVPEAAGDESLTGAQQQTGAIVSLIAISVWINYMIFSEWRFGRTVGKSALGVRVARVDGAPLSWNAALVRNLMRLPDLVAIFFTVPASPHGQRLGDRAAGTTVLRSARDGGPPVPERPATAEAPGAEGGAGWSAPLVVAGLGLLLVVTVLAAAVVAAFDPDIEALAAVLALQAVLAAAMLGVPFLLAPKEGRPRSRALGLGPSLRAPVKTAVAAYAVYLVCALVISALLSPEQEDITRELGVDEGTLGAIAAFFLIVIAAPVAEEVFFRGFMFAGIRSHGSFLVAAIISAGIWGLFHFTGSDSWPVVLQLSIFGVILAAVYERTGSIRPTIALHMLNNAIAFTVLVAG